MAGPNYVLDKGFRAGAAMEQFRAVKYSGTDQTTVIKSAALTDACIGVVQEGDVTALDVTNQRLVDVRILGITRLTCSAAIALGAPVRADATGQGTVLAVTTANQNVLGIALSAATTSGDQIDVLLTPGMQRST